MPFSGSESHRFIPNEAVEPVESRQRGYSFLELQMSGDDKIAFFDYASFDPDTRAEDKKYELPVSIKAYAAREQAELESSGHTYTNTIRHDGWQDDLFTFIASYLSTDATHLLAEYSVHDLTDLTVKQATDLCTSTSST